VTAAETPRTDERATLTEAEREDLEDVVRAADRIQGFSDTLLMDRDDLVLAMIDTPATGPNLHTAVERILTDRLAAAAKRVEDRLEAMSHDAPGYYDDVIRVVREETR
jgi:hypothetical protein